MSRRVLTRCSRTPTHPLLATHAHAMHAAAAAASSCAARVAPATCARAAASPGMGVGRGTGFATSLSALAAPSHTRFLFRRFASAAAAAPSPDAGLEKIDLSHGAHWERAASVAHAHARASRVQPAQASPFDPRSLPKAHSLDAQHEADAHDVDDDASATFDASAEEQPLAPTSDDAAPANDIPSAAPSAPAAVPAGESSATSADAAASSAAAASAAPVEPAPSAESVLLARLNMEEEELAALWRDYVRSTGVSTAAASSGVSRQTFMEQCLMESSAVAEKVAAYKAQAAEVIRLGRGTALGPAQSMLLGWYTPFVARVQEELDAVQGLAMESQSISSERERGIHLPGRRLSSPENDRLSTGNYLAQLSAPELACITMHEFFGMCLNEPNGVKFIAACVGIGRAVNLECKISAIRANRQEWKAMMQALAPTASATLGANAPAGGTPAAASAAAPGQSSTAAPAPAPSPAPSQQPAALAGSSFFMSNSAMGEVSRRAKRVKSETWNESTCVKVGSLLLSIFLKAAHIPAEIIEQAARDAAVANGGAPAWSPALPLGAEVVSASSDSASSSSSSALAGAAPGADPSLAAALPLKSKPGPPGLASSSPSSSAASPNAFYPAFQHFYMLPSRKPGTTASGFSFEHDLVSPAASSSSSASSSQHVHALPYQASKGGGAQQVGMVRADPRVLAAVVSDGKVLDSVMPKLQPMLIPPKQWTAFDNGGYVTVRHKLVRANGSMMQLDAVRSAPLSKVYSAVNYLGNTPWQVHQEVFSVVKGLWAAGGGVADLPSRKDKALPPPPAKGDREGKRIYESLRLYNSALHSQRCDIEYKLRAAEIFGEGAKRFFYPYFLDFRGRAYPIPPYLNHTGGDLSRGLLKFAEGRPLGEKGLHWLLVHMATLYGGGIDKASFADRARWTEGKINEIRESVENPLGGQRWWLTAEKPFQFLGGCIELLKALRCPDGPAKFVSTLPVHTDGSCNGLQHYAALGRDKWGGSCVNLTPSDKPQDVYSRVLDTVRQKLGQDANNPSHPRFRTAGKLISGAGITRKIVKQTVMTSVYGVTMIGARDQIYARLLERPDLVTLFQPTGGVAMGEDDLRSAALYLAQLTLSSLFDAFAGARRIQDWLGDCAVRMASVQQPVSWVTPLGLPVIQPYRQAALYTVQTAMQSVTIVDHSDLLPVSSLRQKSAFPPNFIHSLDASHMLLTASACQQQGLTFASVHDSFWTHAGSMDALSSNLRSEFVRLYERPILEQVRDAWVARFPEINFHPVPKRGVLDIKEVLKSPYFFN